MTKFGKLVVGTIVGAALTLGMSGVALAAPVTSTTAGSPSTTAGTTGTTSPSTSQPSTTQPSTTQPSTSTTQPATTSPSTTLPSTTSPTPPAQSGLSKSLTRTASQIYRIVRPRHPIDCARSAQELKKVRSADAAAAKRLGRWQGKNSADTKSQGKHAAVRVKHASKKVRVFQKLEQDGQALIARIDTKCGSANSSK